MLYYTIAILDEHGWLVNDVLIKAIISIIIVIIIIIVVILLVLLSYYYLLFILLYVYIVTRTAGERHPFKGDHRESSTFLQNVYSTTQHLYFTTRLMS